MIAVKGLDIPFTIQLIHLNSTFETGATVTYEIYNSEASSILVSSQTTTYNSTLNSYMDNLDVGADWTSQEAGNYVLVWTIENTTDFPSTMVENFQVIDDTTQSSSETSQILENTEQLLEDTTSIINITNETLDNTETIINNTNNISSDTTSIINILTEVNLDVKRILGLVQENTHIDQTTYNGNGDLTSCRIRLYTDSSSVATNNNILATYEMEATYDAGYNMIDYIVRKV